MVDDGSTDESPLICDEYAEKDFRIRTIHKSNGGVSSARNIALDIATGEWVTFIDSDDTIRLDFIENLFQPILSDYRIEFVHGGCYNFAAGKIKGLNQSYDDVVSTDPVFLFNNSRGLAVSKLFKLKNINNWGGENTPLRFDNKMRVAEDMAFTMDYISKVKCYAFVSECGYLYRVDNMQSITKKPIQPDYKRERIQYIHFYRSITTFIASHALDQDQSSYRYRQCANIFQVLLNSLYLGGYDRKERLLALKEWDSLHYKNLSAFNPSSKTYYLLAKGKFTTFDLVTFIIRYPYRLRYSRFWSVVEVLRSLLKK